MSSKFLHFLNFKSLPSVGRIQVSEPEGFDGSTYKVKRDAKSFGRDVHLANEKQELTFTREHFEMLPSVQYLPNGLPFKFASHGFYFIKDIYQNEGGEGEIEYIIQKNGVDFITGVFDMYTPSFDYNEVSISIVQNTNREVFKRLGDTDVNAFNDKDLEGNDIAPCPTVNVLLKAKPVYQESSWIKSGGAVSASASVTDTGSGIQTILKAANNTDTTVKYGLENSLNFLDTTLGTNTPGVLNDEGFTYAYAQNRFNNVNIEITNIDAYSRSIKSVAHVLTASGYARLVVKTGIDVDHITNEYILYEKDFTNTNSGNFALPSTLSLNIPFLERGTRIYIYAYCGAVATFDGGGVLPAYVTQLVMNSMDIAINAVSTSINTIAPGIRIIELYKHNVRSIVPTMTVDAPEYDVNGEHYDNFCFNGLMLGGITSKPFNNRFKDLNNIFRETCSDYQLNETNIEVLPYLRYYNNVEMAVLDQVPSNETITTYNPIYALKNAEFKFNKSSSERETNTENSIDDVHTETQKLFPTKKADNVLKEEIKHIRSNFLFENARKRGFDNDQTSSLENDDDLFIKKCIPISPSERGSFNGVLSMQIDDAGVLQILNNNLNGDGINFNWSSMGLLLGTQVNIIAGENISSYLVSNVVIPGEPLSVLSLTHLTGYPVPTFSGDAFISLDWAYTGVTYMLQNDEGYTLVEGVSNPESFGNLDYTWGRNIQRWYPYMATASKHLLGKFITTTSFKVNGNLRTQKVGEAAPVGDSDPISTTAISTQKVLNPYCHKIKVYADFATATQLIRDIGAVKGYVTVRLNNDTTVKGFPYDAEYQWFTEELVLSIEEKYISDFVEITNVLNLDGSNTIYVDEVGKLQKSGVASYIISDIFVILYDSNNVALIEPARFARIKINGVSYADEIDFCNALDTILAI